MARLNIPLFIAFAVSLLSVVPANARNSMPHQRMIRKRGPVVVGGPGPISGGAAAVIGLRVRQAPGPTDTATESRVIETTAVASESSSIAAPTKTSASTSSVATSSSSNIVETTSIIQATTAASSTSSSGLLNSLTSALPSTSTPSATPTSSSIITASTASIASSASSASSAARTTASTSSAVAQTTAQQQATTTAAAAPSVNIINTVSTAPGGRVTSISIITSIAPAEASASAVAAAKAKTAKITRNTIITLVAIASCIGGAIGIWTVIRKWKFSPSEKFDDRMQPIDWAPPAAGAAEDAIEEKSKHRRGGSGASHGSFTSGGITQSEQSHGKYNDSQHGHGYGLQPQDFPPAHDFTAGAAQPGGYGQYYVGQQYAVGGPGYADLQRGPSMSDSTYSHGASISRGLSYNHGNGVQPGAGPAPPLPNLYEGEHGYDDYGIHPVGQQPQGQGQVQFRAY